MYEFLASIANYVGLFGVGLCLLAYYLITSGKIKSNSLVFQLLNFFGAGLLLFSLCFHWNLASVIIQIAWMTISVIGMVKNCTRSKSTKNKQNNMTAPSHLG